MPESVTETNTSLVFPVETSAPAGTSRTKIFIAVVLIVILGGVVGYFLASGSLHKNSTATLSATTGKTMVNTSTEVGSTDTSTFKDPATGVLVQGGLNGEGTHHLTRPGGDSQTVYLISSIVDLDQYVGKKVQIFGQTLKARKAAWLMDVGRLKILE